MQIHAEPRRGDFSVTARSSSLRRRALLPSLSDCLFVACILLLFVSRAGWFSLLSDGDTGWHIRTGQHILDHHVVPANDLFSFSKPGQPWFAWEWGADVLLALAHNAAGLRGVVFLTAVVLGLALLALFRYMIWRGAGVHIAIGIAIVVMGAGEIHFLARPHIFTLLLVPVSLWMMEREIEKPTPMTWLLIPIAAIWTNLHGGFLVLLSSLALFTAVFGLLAITGVVRHRNQERFRRFAVLTFGCCLATLANPYGIRLYAHLLQYLRSDWIINAVDEFQSPAFRSEAMFKYELLLVLGLCCVPALFRRSQIAMAGLILLWAHESLASARHVPIFAFIAAAPIASELTRLWKHWTSSSHRSSVLGVARDMFEDLQTHASRTSIWIPVFLLLLFVGTPRATWPADFPESKFPVALLSRNPEPWRNTLKQKRLLSSDSWGGYLIYRFFPQRKVFMDGRSDFYGESLGKDYLCLRSACANWRALMSRFQFDSVLIPPNWPLADALRQDPNWRLLYEDKLAVWFEAKSAVSGPAAR